MCFVVLAILIVQILSSTLEMKKRNVFSAAFISTLLLLPAPFHPTATEKIVLHGEGNEQTNRNLSDLLGLQNKTLLQRSY